ncbi:MAG: DinB family protein [Acidobacteriota bacterium]|jgi:hypothetical protein
MNPDKVLREQLVALLEGGHAHMSPRDILKGVPSDLRGRRPEGVAHTAWQLLEHLRIAQWDILEFSRNPKHVSPKWPDGYWPESDAPPDGAAWEKSVKSFHADNAAMQALVSDTSMDLYEPFAHGKGQTLLREALLTADHNSYHLGQFVQLRRLLGCF